jgi:hypothetical protein
MSLTNFFIVTDTLLCGYFMNEYFRINHPEKHEQFVITLSTNCIYYFSKMQILLNKYKPAANSASSLKEEIVELVSDGVVYYKTTKKDVINYDHTNEYELALYSIITEDGTNKRVYDFINIPKTVEEFSCEKADFKFILSELVVGDTKVKLNFEDFYVVGNVFNPMFIRYFLNTYYKNSLVNPNDDYTICILDHNVNSIELNKNMGIKINKDNYEVINFDIPCVD